MKLRDIALLNLRRRKGKAVFLLVGLLIGVSTVVTLVSLVGAMTQNINEKLERFGANILILPKTETLALSYGGLQLGGVSFDMKELSEDDVAKIMTIPNSGNIAAAGPMLLDVAEVGGKKVLTAGIDFTTAATLKPWWKVAGEMPGEEEVLVGAEAARLLGLKTGDKIYVKGNGLTVASILESTGSQDDHLIFTWLATAQRIFDKEGAVSMVEVAALCKDCPIEDMVSQITTALPGAKTMAIQQVVKGRMETLHQLKTFSYGVSAIVLLVGGLTVLVTMMGSVRERTSEIGVFRALGFRKSHVMQIILTEAGVISVLAGLLGYPIGLIVTKITLPFFAGGEGAHLAFDPALAGGALALSVALGILASLYPALSATKMDPNEALRAL